LPQTPLLSFSFAKEKERSKEKESLEAAKNNQIYSEGLLGRMILLPNKKCREDTDIFYCKSFNQ
jgi:hypothetical protein